MCESDASMKKRLFFEVSEGQTSIASFCENDAEYYGLLSIIGFGTGEHINQEDLTINLKGLDFMHNWPAQIELERRWNELSFEDRQQIVREARGIKFKQDPEIAGLVMEALVSEDPISVIFPIATERRLLHDIFCLAVDGDNIKCDFWLINLPEVLTRDAYDWAKYGRIQKRWNSVPGELRRKMGAILKPLPLRTRV